MPRIVASLVLGLLAPAAFAQCFEPNLGTPLGAASNPYLGIILPMQPIGLAFPLGGTTYTHIHIADRGHAYFSNAGVPPVTWSTPDRTPTAAELASGGPRIAALWSNLQVATTTNGLIYMNSSPTRCVITWKNMTCYSGTCQPFDLQMQLFATGEVSVIYFPGATNNSLYSFPTSQVGVVGISPGFTTLGAPSDLSAGGATPSDLVFEEWPAPNTFDMAGRVLQFIPTHPGYVFQQPQACATATRYGDGCVQVPDSVYEGFGFTAGFDLNNTTITWLRSSDGYTMSTAIPGTFVAPGPTAINIAPGQRDGQQVVWLSAAMPVPGGTTSALNVTTKGQVEFASSTGGIVDLYPTTIKMLEWPRTAFHCWHDYDQTVATSGLILFEEVGGVAYVTWNGVPSQFYWPPNTFQFQFDLASGNVKLVMLAMTGITLSGPSGWPTVIGYSIGGMTFDPGPTDISALAGVVQVFDTAQGLELGATSFPFLGSSFSFDTSHVPNLVPLAFLLFGDTAINPGVDLTFLGMPGCSGYTNANLASLSFPVTQPAGTGSVVLPIPSNPGLVGVPLTAQSIAFSLQTPLNLVSSNGMRATPGF